MSKNTDHKSMTNKNNSEDFINENKNIKGNSFLRFKELIKKVLTPTKKKMLITLPIMAIAYIAYIDFSYYRTFTLYPSHKISFPTVQFHSEDVHEGRTIKTHGFKIIMSPKVILKIQQYKNIIVESTRDRKSPFFYKKTRHYELDFSVTDRGSYFLNANLGASKYLDDRFTIRLEYVNKYKDYFIEKMKKYTETNNVKSAVIVQDKQWNHVLFELHKPISANELMAFADNQFKFDKTPEDRKFLINHYGIDNLELLDKKIITKLKVEYTKNNKIFITTHKSDLIINNNKFKYAYNRDKYNVLAKSGKWIETKYVDAMDIEYDIVGSEDYIVNYTHFYLIGTKENTSHITNFNDVNKKLSELLSRKEITKESRKNKYYVFQTKERKFIKEILKDVLTNEMISAIETRFPNQEKYNRVKIIAKAEDTIGVKYYYYIKPEKDMTQAELKASNALWIKRNNERRRQKKDSK